MTDTTDIPQLDIVDAALDALADAPLLETYRTLLKFDDGMVTAAAAHRALAGGAGAGFAGWTADDSDPANVNSNGGDLEVAELDVTRNPFIGDPTLVATSPRNVLVRAENGNILFYIDAYGGLVVQHDDAYPAPPDGARLNQFIVTSLSDDGSGSELYALGMGAVNFGASIYGQVGTPWQADTARPYASAAIPTTPNGYSYLAIVAGTTDSVEPDWPTSFGGTVVDGTVTWKCFGLNPPGTPFKFYGPRDNDGETAALEKVSILQIWKSLDDPPAWGIGPSGEEQLFATPEPDDADVATSQRAQYYDDTVGAPKLRIKQRDADGTLVERISASLTSDAAAFAGVEKVSITVGDAPELLAALVTLGLVTDDT